jgi:FkbM family methyltransferase
VKFLFVAKQQKNADAFRATLKAIVERGHDVTIAIQEWDEQRDRRLESEINSERFHVLPCPSARMDEWGQIAPVVRRLRDCLHIVQPAFAESDVLRLRIVGKLREELSIDAEPEALDRALSGMAPQQRQRIDSVLQLAERALPTSDLFDEFLRSQAPDVVLISPLVHFGSAQADVAASARRMGLPVWMLLFSWDNLSTKGCMHVVPDLMFVWNERQKREAEQLHRYPASRVVVIGAARFDGFFRLKPKLTRSQFHESLGLDPAKPTLLYLCSSRLIVPRELPFIRRWVSAMRNSASESLRTCNIVIRPHPDVPMLAEELEYERHRWPGVPELDSRVAKPFGEERALVLRTSYQDSTGLFESLAHSTAVVGLNTTAELEAGIVGRPVFTIHPDTDSEGGPRPTVHFHYLTREHGGFVASAASLDEHVAQVGATLDGPAEPAPIRAFIESFLRPRGIDAPVSPLLAEELIRRAQNQQPVEGPEPHIAASDLGAGPTAAAVIPLAYRGGRILVHATPETLESEADGEVRIEKSAIKWLERWVKIGDVVYDIGAGFGAYVLIAARQRGAVVVAFEPGYRAYSALCDNVVLNACQGSVIPVPLAVSSRESMATIKYSREFPGGSRHSVQPKKWRPRSADVVLPNAHSVCATNLDAAVAQFDLPAANHLRVSGTVSAVDVLQGAERTLAHPSLRTVWLRVAPKHESSILERFGAAGFETAVRREGRTALQFVFTRDQADGAAHASAREEAPAP